MALAKAYKGYTGMMWDKLSVIATWQPDVQLAVGDVVTGGPGGVVTRETTLQALGVPSDRLACTEHEAAPVREHKGVTISASGSVAVNAVAAAGKARASFTEQASFLVVTSQGQQRSVGSMADARAVVEELSASKVWQPEWHLVTAVRSYPACTIVIAKSGGVEAEVSVNVPVTGVVGVEGVKAGADVSVNADHASYWVMPFSSTPLFEAVGMKRRLLRRQSAVQVAYLTRDTDPLDDAEAELVFAAQRSSPADFGLL
ncbi:hypothetical protein ABZU25_31800 [Micromonospora sp. NPDC005215]|uniref:hypothetical protein n=1 Tax=Micromonospora sp. NPDC005215 TaxID=3157024 RepID=UPI0033B77222